MPDTAWADPPGPITRSPVPTIPPFFPPGVFCWRLIDIKDVPGDMEGNAFDFEFEILNWTNMEAEGVSLSKAIDPFGPTLGGNPFFSGSSVDVDGRPIGPGSDDAQFSPADGTGMPIKLGAVNGFLPTSVSPTDIGYVGPGVPFRDLLGAPGTSVAQTTAALGLVPGPGNFVDPFGRPVIPDFETIDNGGFAGDLLPDNVLDGFVMRIDDFDPGEVISINWFLEDGLGAPIGTVSGGNAYGFGNINISRGADLPAIWRREPGNPFGEGQNSGAFIPLGPTRDQFTSVSDGGAVFVPEFGAALTAPFENPLDACPDCDVNGELIPQPVFVDFGHDVFRTQGGESFLQLQGQDPVRLQGLPIPDDFFGELTGSPGGCEDCDTVVRRLGQIDPLGPAVQEVPIEMIALSLRSIDPIDLGNGQELFDVQVSLSPQPQIGSLLVDLEKMSFFYDLPVELVLIGDQGTFLNESFFFQGQGQFSSEDLTKLTLQGVNEGFLPLLFNLDGFSFSSGTGMLLTLGVPSPAIPSLPGDANGDGVVDLIDLDILGQQFGQPVPPGTGPDFNGDGVVDLVDLDILGQFFGTVAAATPEPTTISMLALGLLCAKRRRP